MRYHSSPVYSKKQRMPCPCPGTGRRREEGVLTLEASWLGTYNAAKYGWSCQKMQNFSKSWNEQTCKPIPQAMQNWRALQHFNRDLATVGQLGIHLRSEPVA